MRRDSARRHKKAILAARDYCRQEVFPLMEIDRRHGWPPGTTSQLMKHAREHGMVTLRTELRLPIHREIGSELGKKFSPVRVLVINPDDPFLHKGRIRRGSREEDDILHEMLGRTAAQHLSRRLRNLDVVGVGAGRAVFHTVRALATVPGDHEKTRNIAAMALHGRAERRVWIDTSMYALQSIDTLRVIDTLAMALPRGTTLPLDLPLLQKSQVAVEEAFNDPAKFLSRRAWTVRPPSMALVGIGLMGGPPGMGPDPKRTKLASPPLKMAPDFKVQLMDLRRIAKTFWARHGYNPISNVCDRLFWVPDPGVEEAMAETATTLMTQVNSRLLTIETGMAPHPRIPTPGKGRARRGSLDQVQEVVVVAGGRHKMHAIHRLLTHERPDKRRFMDALVTDLKTAEFLLKQK